jgi:hypothetical protein
MFDSTNVLNIIDNLIIKAERSIFKKEMIKVNCNLII